MLQARRGSLTACERYRSWLADVRHAFPHGQRGINIIDHEAPILASSGQPALAVGLPRLHSRQGTPIHQGAVITAVTAGRGVAGLDLGLAGGLGLQDLARAIAVDPRRDYALALGRIYETFEQIVISHFGYEERELEEAIGFYNAL